MSRMLSSQIYNILVNTPSAYTNGVFPARLDVPGLGDKVILISDQTVHYGLSGTEADEEWESLLPLLYIRSHHAYAPLP